MPLHWIDNVDSYICPVCRFETYSPAKYVGCQCPRCGFQDEKDIGYRMKVNKMRLKNTNEINDFLSTVESCVGDVYLTSIYGDKFSLKSIMSRYIAMGALLGEHGDDLELFCEMKEDESKFLKFFYEHEDVL